MVTDVGTVCGVTDDVTEPAKICVWFRTDVKAECVSDDSHATVDTGKSKTESYVVEVSSCKVG